ncbi:alcohol dehydrogenase catalytic domain-containing protein [Promicromonospora thailandica]|uniref:NADPH2:quinone reductase n=1 Tax=Promicromonospora thailandica TaxID=765201 RepID=A0A9X2GBK0_9MICO|nr:zinc-binding dehydrogenase [Promicromonospora thailandica]MCP2265461.1 NADPH2:quinone reductase [Promicromonospora thailandica]BFF17011.1 zinc-binding dehydrogenase [Promicromonospora thailandica]
MDAIRHHSFGPPEVLVLEQVPDPAPGPGEVLVDAVAHGVHLLDTSLRRGEAGAPLPLPGLPSIPGREVAGTVSAVGPGVDPSWRGRPVAAHLGPVPDGGGYARRVVVGANRLHALPDGPDGAPLDPADAIAMIGTGRMAVYTLDLAAITPDDVVVVTGAAGGLGTLLVQEALYLGASVVALAGGPAKLAVLARLAADPGRLALVDYSTPGWADAARAALGGSPATLVLDGVGGEPGTGATALLAGADHAVDGAARGTVGPGDSGAQDRADRRAEGRAAEASAAVGAGRLVAYGWASGTANQYTAWAGDDRIPSPVEVRYAVGPDAPAMGDQRPYQERALAHAASGRWRVVTHRVPLAEAARAHRELEERRTTGKVVLV